VTATAGTLPERLTLSAPGAGPSPWPRSAVVAGLAALALCLALQEVLLPAWTAHVSPAVLAVVTLLVGVLVFRHGRRLAAPVRAT
jgi:hypothetical protein